MARAVDRPAQADGAADAHAGGTCLNCGATLAGAYCHVCGQPAHVHRTLSAIGHDILHGVFHFEGRLWRTLPMLFFHPGELTRRYVAGERARFVSPLAAFLFSVFLMFAVFNALGGSNVPGGGALVINFTDFQSARDPAQAPLRALTSQLVAREQERAHTAIDDPARVKIDAEIAEVRARLFAMQAATGGTHRAGPDTGWHALDKGLEKLQTNPGLVLYKLQNNAYKFSWALILLSTPLLAMLFLWRRPRVPLYDHAVFVTYSITFVSLVVILGEILGATLGRHIAGDLLTFAVPAHFFFQLRGAYGLGWFSALWRTVALVVIAGVVLGVFAGGMVLLGLLG